MSMMKEMSVNEIDEGKSVDEREECGWKREGWMKNMSVNEPDGEKSVNETNEENYVREEDEFDEIYIEN